MKKIYIIPEVNVITMTTTNMIAYSGGAPGDVAVSGTPDTGTGITRSRGFDWDDEED